MIINRTTIMGMIIVRLLGGSAERGAGGGGMPMHFVSCLVTIASISIHSSSIMTIHY